MQTIADAFFQGVNAKQRKTENEYRKQLFERGERDYQEQRAAKDAFGRAVTGDESALPDLARADPGSYMQFQNFKAGQKSADIKQKREAAQYAVDTLGTIELMPPQQRPQAYAAARAEAARLGYDTSGIPEQYDPVAVRTAALRSKSVLDFLAKQSENAITTSPGAPGLFGGGAPGFNGGSFGGGAPAGRGGSLPPLVVPKDAGSYFGGAVDFHAKKYNLPPGLFPRMIAQESDFDPKALGPETKYGRAIGLTQLMPDTAKELGVAPNDPVQNIAGGAKYLRMMLDKYQGDQATALMAYNWGPGNVDNWIKGGRNPAAVPMETRKHLERILGPQGGQAPQGGAAPMPQQPGAQVAQAPGNTLTDAGVQPLFRGGKPFNDGLPAGYQWGQDQQGNRVQMRIPGGKVQLKQVTLDDGVWNVDEYGNKVTKLGERPSRNEGEGRGFKEEEKLRTAFQKQSSNFTDLRQHFTRLQAASSQNDGAGDIAMVYSFMKMLDPTSVVREGEFATAANAGGVPDRVVAMYNSVINGQRLSPDVRASFLQQGAKQFEQAYNQYDATRKVYTDLAKSYELDPARVVIDLSGGVARPQIGGPPPGGDRPAPQPGQPSPQQGNVPRAVNPATGETLILQGGQWVPEGR